MYRTICLALFLSIAWAAPASACNWHQALANIKGVLDGNTGPKACFADAYRCQLVKDPKRGGMFVRTGGCKSGIDALLNCQRQDKHAQKTIKECAKKAKAYLKSHGYRR